MSVTKLVFGPLLIGTLGFAQIVIPSGTKVRLRLDQTVCSSNTDPGQTVELSVLSGVRIKGVLVFQERARAVGTIMPREAAHPSLLSGVDFSVDRVQAVDGAWVPIRYKRRSSSIKIPGVRVGMLSAGVVPSFWPSFEPVLIVTGRNVTLKKGAVLEVFTDTDHTFANN